MSQTLIIRADANTQSGTGHLMRCLALAQAWQAQGDEAIFVTACTSDSLRRRLTDEDFQVIGLPRPYPDPADWELTSKVLATHPDTWVVLDGYHFRPSYQLRVKDSGHPLLVIDDMAHLDHYYADVVLNQNIHAEQLDYSCEPYARMLLGSRYVLLRREFWPWREWQREIPQVAHKVLVTLGGADPDNQTFKAISALRQAEIDGLEAIVVVGASNPHFRELEKNMRHWPLSIRLVRNTSNMPALMTWADLAVSSGGTTCWESAFLRLPTVVGQIAQIEDLLVSGLKQLGLFYNAGWFARLSTEHLAEVIKRCIQDKEWRIRMSRLGHQTVDGLGGARILETLNYN